MNEQEVVQIIKDRLGISINRFDRGYLEVSLTIDGTQFATESIAVPDFDGGDND